MRFDIIGKNYVLGDKIKEVIERKVSKLGKYFDGDVLAKVVCSEVNSYKYKMEITIILNNNLLRSEASSDNQYDNIDILLPKIEKQIVKHRTKLQDKIKQNSFDDFIYASGYEDRDMPKVVREKSLVLSPVSVEDAQAEMELSGHDFYAFININTGFTNILYIRKDKNLGLIELR